MFVSLEYLIVYPGFGMSKCNAGLGSYNSLDCVYIFNCSRKYILFSKRSLNSKKSGNQSSLKSCLSLFRAISKLYSIPPILTFDRSISSSLICFFTFSMFLYLAQLWQVRRWTHTEHFPKPLAKVLYIVFI